MDLVKLTSDYEIWKIANKLASDLYPVEYSDERKKDRERLIDFKNGLREIKKPKHELKSNLKLLDKFLTYMNPKRKWVYDDASMLETLYKLEIRADDLFDLCEKGDIHFEDTDLFYIFRFLIDHEIYDEEALDFLFTIYEVDRPKHIDWGIKTKKFEYDELDLTLAKKIRSVSISDQSPAEIVKSIQNAANYKKEELKKAEKKISNTKNKEEKKKENKISANLPGVKLSLKDANTKKKDEEKESVKITTTKKTDKKKATQTKKEPTKKINATSSKTKVTPKDVNSKKKDEEKKSVKTSKTKKEASNLSETKKTSKKKVSQTKKEETNKKSGNSLKTESTSKNSNKNKTANKKNTINTKKTKSSGTSTDTKKKSSSTKKKTVAKKK